MKKFTKTPLSFVTPEFDACFTENSTLLKLLNEYYAKDISKKRRIVNKLKGNSGEPLSLPPYGYAGVIIGTNPRSLENTGVSPI